MKTLRVLLFVALAILLILDLRVAALLLSGPDIVVPSGTGDGWSVVPLRVTLMDYVALAVLVTAHAIVAFGLIRTRN